MKMIMKNKLRFEPVHSPAVAPLSWFKSLTHPEGWKQTEGSGESLGLWVQREAGPVRGWRRGERNSRGWQGQCSRREGGWQ